MNKTKKLKGPDNVLKFRQHLAMDQEEFAALIGVGQTAVSHYEQGRRIPVYSVAKNIITLAREKKYNLTWDDLYG